MPKLPKPLSLEFLLLSAIALGILLRIINLNTREFWYDEVLSLLLATGQEFAYKNPPETPVLLADYSALLKVSDDNFFKGIFNLIKGIAARDVHPPLSYLSFYFGLRLFGNSEATLRGVSVLYSIGSILAAYGLGKRVLGYRGGLLLSALLAVNPYFLSHSLNGRMYAPFLFWTILSAWSVLELKQFSLAKINENSQENNQKSNNYSQFIWSLLLIISITAGLLTQYLFVYWVISLSIFIIIFDRRRWWQEGLLIGLGTGFWLLWFMWGTRQQIRNRSDVFGQISQENVPFFRHIQDFAQTLGTHLLLGDWVSPWPEDSPNPLAINLGYLVIILLIFITFWLWKQGDRYLLALALTLGIMPLLLSVAIDISGNKLTVGFGWGRSMIFILPGCLLLLTIALETATKTWQKPIILIVLIVYLGTGIADFTGRSRHIFQPINNLIQQQPTLIIMNSKAWGHLLRLAYYIPPTSPVSLLAQNSEKLAETLKETLNKNPFAYPRLIWLNSADPVWGKPKSETEALQFQQEVKTILQSRYQLQQTQPLSGTMELDKFTAYLYQEREQGTGNREQ